MKLLQLRLRNFKGVRDFTLDTLGGGNVSVFGDNATGKTTLADAFTWLLFDKDSSNRKDFEIKTLGQDGEPVHGLEHEVEAVLDLEERGQIALRKVYSEQWTKRRGSAGKQFTGHTTDHCIDLVPVKKAEYEQRIGEIADESVFRLLTDPNFFNEQLHWQRRRAILLEVCGDVTDEEVIQSEGALAGLPDILGNRTLDQHRKVILARRAEINKDLEQIPVRISEVQRGLPDLPEDDRLRLETRLVELRARRQQKAEEKARIEAGGQAAKLQKRHTEIEGQLLQLRLRAEEAIAQAVRADSQRLSGVRDQIDACDREARQHRSGAHDADRAAYRIGARTEALRAEWHQVNAQEFDEAPPGDGTDTCPACGQALPVDRVREARDRAQAAYEERLGTFNERKARRLEELSAEGKHQAADRDRLIAERNALLADEGKAGSRLAGLQAEAGEIQTAIERKRAAAPERTDNPEYRRLQEEKAGVEAEIAALRTNTAKALEQVAAALAEADAAIRADEGHLARIEQRERGLARIEELKAEERRLAAEYEELERQLHLAEEFIRAKVRLLEDRINSRFELARFKLFSVLVNGGVEECCETVFQGVPYSTALNNGARINVGLDIINTLSDHYKFTAPIWIDNREAVTRLTPSRAQVISLLVSELDKQLRVEHEAQTLLEEDV